MRSVVVVLPASMWAMIPMFRVFSSVNLRGMEDSLLCLRSSCVRGALAAGKETGPAGPVSLHMLRGPVRKWAMSRLTPCEGPGVAAALGALQRQANIAGVCPHGAANPASATTERHAQDRLRCRGALHCPHGA